MQIDYNREENWKKIIGPDLEYYISDKGNLKRKLKSGKFTHVDGFYKEDGYKMFALKCEGKGKIKHAHKLVAIAFLDPVDGKKFVNHIIPDKTINFVENLEWCTNQENIQHSQKNVVYRRNKNVLKFPKNISPKEKNEFFIRHHRDIINLMENKVSRVKIIKDHKMPISLRYLSVISKKVRDFKNLYGSIEHLLKNNQIQMMMF